MAKITLAKYALVATLSSLVIILMQVPAIADNNTHQRRINIAITSHLGDKQTYTEGDVISFYLSLDRDAYVLIIYQDAVGKLTQIIPNELSNNNYFKAGDFLSVPNSTSPFKFVISKPFGTEYLWAFANDKPFPELNGTRLKNGFILLKGTLSNIREILQNYGRNSNGYSGQANTAINTVPTPP